MLQIKDSIPTRVQRLPLTRRIRNTSAFLNLHFLSISSHSQRVYTPRSV